jgi:LysR family transcriptional regulator, transcriptional activator of nhaA
MTSLNYHHLYLFMTVARSGSFREASDQLKIAQPSITKQVKQLEEDLELILFDRSNKRRIKLTEDGIKALELAEDIFSRGENFLRWAVHSDHQSKTNIKIGVVSSLSRNLVYEFISPLHQHDDTSLEIITGDVDNLLSLLKKHQIDLILSASAALGPSNDSYSSVLLDSPLVFVSNNKGLKRKNLESILQDYPIVIPGRSFDIRPELDFFLDNLGHNIKIKAEIDDIALLRLYALKSSFITCIPKIGVVNELNEQSIIVLKSSRDIFQRYYAISRQEKFPHPAISRLVKELQRKLKT